MEINKYDYSLVNYINNKNKVIIICPKHGEFEQIPSHHYKGIGCSECSKNRKITTEGFIKRSKEKFGDKYDYSLVNYINSKTKVIIICPEHGEFIQLPKNHLSGHGCRKCGKYKSNTKNFIHKALKIHNDKYDYSLVEYINYCTVVNIICLVHGIFEQTPNCHLSGRGCKKCSSENNKSNTVQFIKRASKIHNNFYNYSLVNYENSSSKVNIICPVHGKFKQTPKKHLLGQGCRKCNTDRQRLNTEYFIKRSNDVHNNKYDYSRANYKDALTKIVIICPRHGVFKQIPYSHLSGNGCPRCSHIISKNSQEWLDSFNNKNITREYKIKIKLKYFYVDGYDPKTNTIYEFYGDFWHGNPKLFNENKINPRNKTKYGKLYKKTIERENIIKSAGYNLISIWENEWNNQCKDNCR